MRCVRRWLFVLVYLVLWWELCGWEGCLYIGFWWRRIDECWIGLVIWVVFLFFYLLFLEFCLWVKFLVFLVLGFGYFGLLLFFFLLCWFWLYMWILFVRLKFGWRLCLIWLFWDEFLDDLVLIVKVVWVMGLWMLKFRSIGLLFGGDIILGRDVVVVVVDRVCNSRDYKCCMIWVWCLFWIMIWRRELLVCCWRVLFWWWWWWSLIGMRILMMLCWRCCLLLLGEIGIDCELFCRG